MMTFEVLEQYRNYMLAVLGRSELTIMEYTYDIVNFFRFWKRDKGRVPKDTLLEQIDVSDITVDDINKVTSDDLLVFLIFLGRERKQSNATRARHIASLKSFFKFCHSKKHLIDENPAYDIETPKIGKRLPKYLTLEQSQDLLKAAYESPSEYNERDYCMLTLFLNCGLRLAELRGIDLDHIHGTVLTVIGKGNKERTIYLNQACLDAIAEWLPKRSQMKIKPSAQKAMFISKKKGKVMPTVDSIGWSVGFR
jgi:site-specific recombinase XerD